MGNPLATDLDYVIEHTKDLWEEIRGKQIFITGGTAFFGSWLLESFAWANTKLKLNSAALVLTRNPQSFCRKVPHLCENPAIHFHTGDVRNFEFPEKKFSHIIHAAIGTDAILNKQDPLSLFEGIVQGTRQTLEFARHCNTRKFLLTSSGAVYGKQPSEMRHIAEDYKGAPETTDTASAYAQGKRVSEFLSAGYSERYRFEAKIARCFTFVGPYLPLNMNYAVANFIRDALRGGPINITGDGTPYRSYLYAADLVICLWTILFKGKPCRPYNVGSEDDLTISELARIVASIVSPEIKIEISKWHPPEYPPERYVPSTERVQNELGLKAKVELREAIRRTVNWYKAQDAENTG